MNNDGFWHTPMTAEAMANLAAGYSNLGFRADQASVYLRGLLTAISGIDTPRDQTAVRPYVIQEEP